MATNILFDVTIRNAKPTDKNQRLNDGGGLYLLIKPNGAKWWRFDYTIESKRKTLSLDVYPKTSLNDARKKATTAVNKVANGIDPSAERKAEKIEQVKQKENERLIDLGLPVLNSFEYVAREWGAKKVNDWDDKNNRSKRMLERNIFP
ncbi:MAG: Arm DNA-binding domain-containing protein [Methylobacter sp.]